MVVSGILPVLALALRRRGPLAPLTAELVARLAKEGELLALAPPPSPVLCADPLVRLSAVIREGFGDAGLVPAVLALLTSSDRELLHHAARAASRMSQDSRE